MLTLRWESNESDDGKKRKMTVGMAEPNRKGQPDYEWYCHQQLSIALVLDDDGCRSIAMSRNGRRKSREPRILRVSTVYMNTSSDNVKAFQGKRH
ncbi:hypothetical protein sscle_02g016340 [Sclerotinia sclerotiorum 1980 UF-70]|uniref:Uncharacterized protein n=1 Tax=Sclerotinia sclerotiorum (strain ATCC 18683 / 1980 / Ss-1) TaxID=665079 RepID=A0A1D9PVY0_SCLS1|nr:hypothetical protein sscle_02g016340 [Sclerotinia sclerotiorum 1980 UF-70]